MKILIMCEGPNELAVINILLKHNALTFTENDLLDMRPFHARQLDSTQLKPALNAYHGDLIIYRIGDKLSDKLKVPKDIETQVISQEKFCTKPEIEMLFILAENRLSEFEKTKSTVKPKSFCKQNIVYNRKHYKNNTDFYYEYFDDRINVLTDALKEYKRLHKHGKNEKYLADLLK